MSCNHSLRLGNLCTQCGETVGDESNLFCLLHDNDNLKTTKEEATKMAKEKKKKLDDDGKLVLIIDLDQTILHASCNKQLEGLEYNEVKVDRRNLEKSAKNIANEEAKAELERTDNNVLDNTEAMRQVEQYDFDTDILIDQPKKKSKTNNTCVLYTFYISKVKYYVKLRPHLKEMLDFCYDKYEMHVYTMGNREYAEYIVSIVDPERKYFGTRIITRDENEKLLEKNLNRLSSDHSNIIILDDRGDVWKYVANLINVQPFFFFRSGDINAPEKIGKILREEYENTNDMKDLVYQHDDNCLVSITKLLSNIHQMYFERCKNVKKILKRLRMPIFRHKSFYIDKKIQFDRKNMKRILKNCNGQYKKAKVDIIIADNLNEDILNKQAKYKADIVSIRWVFDCYYSNLPLKHDSYVLKRYDEDEFSDELEDMLDLV